MTINGGPHGFAELLSAYHSRTANHGQSFASLNLIEIRF
jgi:K+-transporting ATPase A subunit